MQSDENLIQIHSAIVQIMPQLLETVPQTPDAPNAGGYAQRPQAFPKMMEYRPNG